MLASDLRRITRLAAQLSREDAGRYRSLDEIARDAERIVLAHRAVSRSESAAERRRAVAQMKKSLAPYRALIVATDEGPAVRFTSGAYSNLETRHVFHV